MHILRILTSLALLTALHCHAKAGAETPDSVVVRDGDGRIVSKSVFRTEGQETTETRTAADGTVVRVVTRADGQGRRTSRREYVKEFNAWVLKSTSSLQLAPDGKTLRRETSTPAGRLQKTEYAYTPDGNLSSEVTSEWDAGEMDWHPALRTDHTRSRQLLPLPSRDYATITRSLWDDASAQWKTMGDVVSIDYDAQGRASSRYTSAGERGDSCTAMTYDTLGRLSAIQTGLYDATGFNLASKEQLQYDSAGRIATRLRTDKFGRTVSSTTYFYRTKAKHVRTEPLPRLRKTETRDAKTGSLICTTEMFYDTLGRTAGMAVDSLNAGRVETAFAYTPAGRLARTVCALIAPADSIEGGAVDDDMPFGSYTVTHMDEGGNPVQALTYSLPDGRVTKSAQWRNTYDSVGRLTSTVRTEWAALCDSVAVVYDVAAERGSAAPDSASRIGRVWMRLAGFFARVKGTLAHDTVAVAVPEAVDSLEDGLREERLLFEWAGKWKCVRREQLAYGPDGELVTEYSYCRPNGSAEWRVVRKVTYEYDGGRVVKAVSSAESANGGGIEAEWERKSLYY